MYLKSLEMKGFKSFADRTSLEFEPGISVIVGPNGSGKSNISEAFLWVMGEQSPRNLRSSKMEDVIFAGSDKRGSLGMAEVSLSFDNSTGTIPMDYEEIVVTRQLFRNGESQYLLNRAPTRLLDIQELLSDFGVGRELTAVIGQNRLERVISSRPEDRRAFIEEAAGLLKHRRRKDKAMRKLDAVEQNMVRLGDIISEVKKQIRPLERQAAVAREYKELEGELKRLQVSLVVSELQTLHQQWENRLEEEERLRVEFEEKQIFLKEGRQQLLEDEKKAHALRESLVTGREKLFALSSNLERLRSEEQLAGERLRFYLMSDGMPMAGLGDLERRRAERQRRLEELGRQHLEAVESLAALDEKVKLEEAERFREAGDYAALNKRRNGKAEEARQGRQQLKYIASQLENLDDEGSRLTRQHESDAERRTEAERSLAEAGSRLRELEQRIRDGRRELVRIEADRAALREGLEHFKTRLEEVVRRQRAGEGDEARVTARLKALEELFDKDIDFSQAGSLLMKQAGSLKGIRGMLLQHLKIDPEWEKALESLLGPWLFAVLVESKDDALTAVSRLRSDEAGFALFLPLDEFRSGIVANVEKRRGDVPGARHAMEVAKFDSSMASLAEHFLGDVFLCSSLEQAVGLSERHEGLTFLTAEGEMVSPRRVIKGGKKAASPFHLIAKQREMERLQVELESFEENKSKNGAEHQEVLATLEKLEADLNVLVHEMEEANQAIHRDELDHKEATLRGEEARERIARLSGRLAENDEARREVAERIGALRVEDVTLRESLEGLTPEIEALDGELREGRQLLDEREKALKELYQSRASMQERIRHLAERAGEVRLSLEQMPADSSEIEQEMAEDRAGHERLIAIIERLRARGERVSEAWTARRSAGEAELAALEEGMESRRTELEACEARVEELRELVHNRDLVAVQMKSRVDMLAQKLLDDYKISIESALDQYTSDQTVDEMREQAEALQRRKEAMGQVNLLAVEEHQAARERYQFLTEQVDDLRQSKGALNKVIRAIDSEIMSIFKETFDEVNLHFQELFERLFPGGRAELVLADPDNLLETGVEVEAQPPGKKLKKMSLLSGGETSLTSLAFLFAIFKTRPSPFYFLDEVEAALDDMNLHRFLRMLDEFKEDSQLIIITHQKRTMEIADILYGVSMQADGISRVISQRFEDDEAEDAVPA